MQLQKSNLLSLSAGVRPRFPPYKLSSCLLVVPKLSPKLSPSGPQVVPMWSPSGSQVVPKWSPKLSPSGPEVVPKWDGIGNLSKHLLYELRSVPLRC